MKKARVLLSYPLSVQRRLIRGVDAQADLSLLGEQAILSFFFFFFFLFNKAAQMPLTQ